MSFAWKTTLSTATRYPAASDVCHVPLDGCLSRLLCLLQLTLAVDPLKYIIAISHRNTDELQAQYASYVPPPLSKAAGPTAADIFAKLGQEEVRSCQLGEGR